VKTIREIGEFVAATRKSQGATQLDLAQMAGVGRRFVVELEAGKESLHIGKVLRVLETLGVGLRLEEPRGL
jgi:y4mF family transcriptional regulator